MKRIYGLFAAMALLLTACGGGNVQSPDFVSVLKGIEIVSPNTPPTAAIGGTLQLTANGLFTTPPGSNSDTVRGAITGVQWASDNANFATVDSTGAVKGLSCGVARIRARAQGFEKAIDVNIGGEVLRQINVAPTSFTIHVGESREFSATGVYRDCAGNTTARTAITQTIGWSATDPAVVDLTPTGAVVNAKGKAVTTGTRIQARATNEEGQPIVGEATLVINPPLLKDLVISGVGIVPPYRVPVGGSLTFEVKGIYSDSSTPRPVPSNPSPVTWTSSNTARATFATDVSNTQNTLTARSKDADPANNAFNISVAAPDGEGGTVRATQPLQITVSDAVLQSVTDIVAVNRDITPLRVASGGTLALVARGMFTDGTSVDIADNLVAWSVANGTGQATISNFNGSSTPPVQGGILTGVAIGSVNVTATASSATDPAARSVTRAASVTDPICVVPYVSPASTAVGTKTGGTCLPTDCSITDAGAVVSPSQADSALVTLNPTLQDATVRLSVAGPSTTATVNQRAGFIISYQGTSFNPATSLLLTAGAGQPTAPQVTPLDPTSDGLTRRLVTVGVTGSFSALAASITVPAVVGTGGLPNPTGLLSVLGSPTVQVRFSAACSTALPPAN